MPFTLGYSSSSPFFLTRARTTHSIHRSLSLSLSLCLPFAMATPLAIRSFRGGQQSSEFGRRSAQQAGGNRSSPCTYAYLGSSPSSSPPSREPYLTLGVTSGASVHDIKKAYRRLALKYHPDVCKGESCTSKFMQINDAYETVMGFLEGNIKAVQQYSADAMAPEPMMGVYDESWEEWEEWMGWEGAGTRDYSTHVNHDL